MTMRVVEEIKSSLNKALGSFGISDAHIALEHPVELAHGDYATSAPLAYSKQVGIAPRALAEKIVAVMDTIEGVSKIEIAGPGFINFTLAPEALAQALEDVCASDMWGSNTNRAAETIMVEYAQPNPFKEFHIGHLMGTTIGETVARLFEFSGAKVIRVNYQGDVGAHVAKAIYGLLQMDAKYPAIEQISAAYAEGARLYEADPMAKQEIDIINKKIYEKSDTVINGLYEHGRKVSLNHFEEIYTKLGTKFDHYFFESETGPIGKEIVYAHPEIFPESDGARIFRGEEYGLHTRVFINSKGLPTYEAKELGLQKLKKDLYPDTTLLVIESANEITEYFRVVKKAMEQIYPKIAAQLLHIAHGVMKLPTGKMSSRTGTVITGESLLAELAAHAKERAAESRAENHDKLAEAIAVAAIKYQILRQSAGKDIIFDRERALSLDGDSGPYVQYSYARTCAILERAKAEGVSSMIYHTDKQFEPNELSRLLYRFPEVVERAANELEPHFVTTFLLDVASAFNSWYARVHILDGTPESAHKVAIVEAVNRTLQNGLWILGIPAPEKM